MDDILHEIKLLPSLFLCLWNLLRKLSTYCWSKYFLSCDYLLDTSVNIHYYNNVGSAKGVLYRGADRNVWKLKRYFNVLNCFSPCKGHLLVLIVYNSMGDSFQTSSVSVAKILILKMLRKKSNIISSEAVLPLLQV